MKKLGSATDPLWYKDAIIYEIHVRAFADSNNDGIGDFPGLMSRLDYLQDLGVTCLWLLPFFPSPLRDDGYDIANYVDVNPSYGTLNDFKQFLDAAHKRNMQVMIELVINHTSDQHPWFKAARLAPPGFGPRPRRRPRPPLRRHECGAGHRLGRRAPRSAACSARSTPPTPSSSPPRSTARTSSSLSPSSPKPAAAPQPSTPPARPPPPAPRSASPASTPSPPSACWAPSPPSSPS